MKTSIVNAIIENLNINKENLKVLINSLPEKQRENALEILLGANEYMHIEIPEIKAPSNNIDKIYTKPLQLKSVNLLEDEVRYREDYYTIPSKWYKSEEDVEANPENFKTYEQGEYRVRVLVHGQKKEDWNNRSMSIREWMADNAE